MRRILFLLFGILLLLSACRQTPAPEQPTAVPPTVSLPTVVTEISATSAPTGQIFVPVVPGEQAAGDSYPAPSPNPSQGEGDSPPTPTPEPAYPAYTGPPLDRDEIGIQIYLHRQDVRELLRHLDALGVGWVKVQVSWKLHEPRPGEYSEELFGELDRLVAGANRAGGQGAAERQQGPGVEPADDGDGLPAGRLRPVRGLYAHPGHALHRPGSRL